jgi:hypothetical protein
MRNVDRYDISVYNFLQSPEGEDYHQTWYIYF